MNYDPLIYPLRFLLTRDVNILIVTGFVCSKYRRRLYDLVGY
jgi:hypothetical protein